MNNLLYLLGAVWSVGGLVLCQHWRVARLGKWVPMTLYFGVSALMIAGFTELYGWAPPTEDD